MKLRTLAFAAALLCWYPASGLPLLGSVRSSAAPSPAYPMAGQQVTFTVTADVPDGLVSNVVICFGDHSCDAESYTWDDQERLNACIFGSNYMFRFFHTYTRPALYRATLDVDTVHCPHTTGKRQSSSYNILVG